MKTSDSPHARVSCLILLWLWGFSCCAWGEELRSTTLTGSPSNRVDILFLGDGYQSHELGTYDAHVDSMLDYMFLQEPFGRYRNFFNVHRIDVISEESGADERPNNIFVETVLGARFFFDGIVERTLSVDVKLADAVVDRSVDSSIDVDLRFVSVNTDKYGGAGGAYATFAGGNELATDLALHELGHAFAGLADEYVSLPGTYLGPEPEEPNITTSPEGEKWAHWIGFEQPGIGTIGVYEGAGYYPNGLYRPSEDSKMRTLGQPFDAVSREQIVLNIYDHVDPLDDFRLIAPVTDPHDTLWVKTIDEDVIDLQWAVDGESVAGSNAAEFNLSQLTDLGFQPGDYEISLLAEDRTDWVRIRRDELQQRVTWNVAYYPGDFNGDQRVDATDIDALTAAVISESDDLAFDLNLDGVVDTLDRDRWLEFRQSQFGDANLDGIVGFDDFVQMTSHFGVADPGWADGNFDLDDRADFNDFLLFSRNFGQEIELPPAAVPEPNGQALSLTVLCSLLALMHRRPRQRAFPGTSLTCVA